MSMQDRRQVLRAGLGLTGAFSLAPLGAPDSAAAAPIRDRPLVNTAEGRLRGIGTTSVNIFKGVRYAHAARFQPPVAVSSWTGVREAAAFGPPCPQHNIDSLPWRDPVPENEDCLFLNVWSPKGATKLPVMVWIHGGAFTWGSGGLSMYDSASLAEHGEVVVVTLNHRLNAFGYMYLGDLSSEFAESSNLGQLDLIAALGWIQRNISAFGGDPGNVTLFGESGGALKVSALLAMPKAQGLFHRAIVQSGSLLEFRSEQQGSAEASALLRKLGLSDADVGQLRTIAPARLVAASQALLDEHGYWHLSNLPFAPVQNRATAPYQPTEASALALWKDVGLLVGTTEAESIFPLSLSGAILEPENDARLEAAITAAYSEVGAERAKALVAAYRARSPGANRQELLVEITTGLWMGGAAIRQAELKVQAGGAPTYMYLFGWKEPLFGGHWSAHAAELPFVFDKLETNSLFVDGDAVATERAKLDPAGARFQLRDAMIAAWSSFARHGRPESRLLPQWPPYTLQDRATMRLDGKSGVVADPFGPAVRELQRAS